MAYVPACLRMDRSELRERVDRALAELESCRACPRDCDVNRLEDRWGACKTGRHAVVGSHFPHFGEEDCLRGWNGSGTIFFSHCNLRCVFCFHPDTLVPTDRGLVRIREIFESGEAVDGDERVRTLDGSVRVPTREGRLAPVVRAFEHEHRGDLVRLEPYSCPPILLTASHRLFVADGSAPAGVRKMRADELGSRHRLVVPKRTPTGEAVEIDVRSILDGEGGTFRTATTRRTPTDELVHLFSQGWNSERLGQITGYHPAYARRLRGRWLRGKLSREPERETAENSLVTTGGAAVPTVRFKTERRPGIPARLPLGEDLAWLLGLYCAEGHVTSAADRPNSHRLVLSSGPDEEEIRDRARRLLERIFGVEVAVRTRRTTVTVEVGKASLALLFRALSGQNSHSKRVPHQLRRTRRGVLRSFLEGYLAGEGSDRGSHHAASTVSRDLADGLFEVGLLLGTLPSYHLWHPDAEAVIEGRRVRQSALHIVKFPKRDPETGRVRTRSKEMDDAFLVPVRRSERVPYDGPVYDLEVDDADHSYLAPHVAVSNCQNYDISQGIKPAALAGSSDDGEVDPPDAAAPSPPAEIADMMMELQERGCHNINLVTPEHVVPQVVEAVAEAVGRGLELPVVYNTSAYDALESLRLMEGIVDVYMPDFKFWTEEASRTYMKAGDYPEVARAAVEEMHRQVGDLAVDEDGLAKRGLIVRHLVMPGMLEETRGILRWVADELGPDTRVNLMDQYYPAGKVGDGSYAEIDRRLASSEFREARAMARELGLRNLDRRNPHPRLERKPHRRLAVL